MVGLELDHGTTTIMHILWRCVKSLFKFNALFLK